MDDAGALPQRSCSYGCESGRNAARTSVLVWLRELRIELVLLACEQSRMLTGLAAATLRATCLKAKFVIGPRPAPLAAQLNDTGEGFRVKRYGRVLFMDRVQVTQCVTTGDGCHVEVVHLGNPPTQARITARMWTDAWGGPLAMGPCHVVAFALLARAST